MPPKFATGAPSANLVKVLLFQQKRFLADPPDHLVLWVDEANIQSWYFLVYGLGVPYVGGEFIFHLTVPNEFPHRPPSFEFLTPNGIYEPGGPICISIGEFHADDAPGKTGANGWRPSLGMAGFAMNVVNGLICPDLNGGIRILHQHAVTRAGLARKSRATNAAATYRHITAAFEELLKGSPTSPMCARLLACRAAVAAAGAAPAAPATTAPAALAAPATTAPAAPAATTSTAPIAAATNPSPGEYDDLIEELEEIAAAAAASRQLEPDGSPIIADAIHTEMSARPTSPAAASAAVRARKMAAVAATAATSVAIAPVAKKTPATAASAKIATAPAKVAAAKASAKGTATLAPAKTAATPAPAKTAAPIKSAATPVPTKAAEMPHEDEHEDDTVELAATNPLPEEGDAEMDALLESLNV